MKQLTRRGAGACLLAAAAALPAAAQPAAAGRGVFVSHLAYLAASLALASLASGVLLGMLCPRQGVRLGAACPLLFIVLMTFGLPRSIAGLFGVVALALVVSLVGLGALGGWLGQLVASAGKAGAEEAP